MTNIQRCVKSFRWNSQMEAAAFAAEIGITTREYNRYEQGLDIDAESLMKILRWCFTDPDPKVVAQPEEPAA